MVSSALGQFFTPAWVVSAMWSLRRRRGRVLEPCCGDGAFLREGMDSSIVALEKDISLSSPAGVLRVDFFDYPTSEKFETIIGNPPYVRNRWISADTRAKIAAGGYAELFDGHANLYLYFIYKSVQHLRAGGELIFITPRDFVKTTGARKLNEYLYNEGSITHFHDFGDERIFSGAMPNCAVWRFERSRASRLLDDGREFLCLDGQIYFLNGLDSDTKEDSRASGRRRLGDDFEVRVGAVSGADEIFTNAKHGEIEFVCSRTRSTGELRRMIYEGDPRFLLPHKSRLLSRRIRRFDESNWWQWGRGYPERLGERIYVNNKTRVSEPFFVHDAPAFDGSVLALFPRHRDIDLDAACARLNRIDWHSMGFMTGGRYLFSQRSLEAARALKQH